jgi:betaine lipid synthase
MTLFLDFDISKFQIFTSVSLFVGVIYLLTKINKTFHSLLVFAWACFVKPIFHKTSKKNDKINTNTNQLALELFYKNQAHIYDATRKYLLKGRLQCLNLAVNHLSKRNDLVWIDIGGGTGSNIESMDKILSIKNFKSVYLIDLSPSLCAIAQEKFTKLGWTNVHVVVADACDFKINENCADLITFSYSLSMIPTFNSAIDHSVKLLDKQGIIAAVDFGIQNSDTSMGRINTLGGLVGRNYPWILRNFWRIWFEADKVFLDSSRRNYLEYKYGTLKSLNCYNNTLGKIPYYIWIGCDKSKSSQILHRVNCLATESPYLAPADSQTISGPISKGHEAALINLQKNLPFPSIYYQKHVCRVYYDELNPLFEQFGNQYIYAFTWEDPREDHKILNFNSNDTVLAITSAGDNILHYASLPNPPKRIHAVDLNPAQNHLLELKLACFRCLTHDQIWSIFGEGKIANFKEILINKLACHMSSQAFQFWIEKGELTFDPNGKGLYDTGFSRWALRLARWVFAGFGVSKHVEELCKSTTMEQQSDIWNNKIKSSLFNPVVSTLLVGNPIFLWKALGVPANQAKMMGNSVFKYVVDTLNPIISRSLISKDNYFYYLALMGKYAYNNCPEYLTIKGYNRLSAKSNKSPIDNIRIHTDTLNDVFDRLKEKSLTIAIIMDHMDWFNPNGKDAINEITALKNCLAPGGRVMLRSASQNPWYISTFEELGFECEAAGVRYSGQSIDRINMYASTWVCTKLKDELALGSRRMSSLKI